jgi:hypothetical protein
MVNLIEFERLLLANWTKFINPQKLIAFVLSAVRDAELGTLKTDSPKKPSLQITLSQFRPEAEGFLIWVDFTIPKPKGAAVGTCELRFNPAQGEIHIVQTLGNVLLPPED